MKPMNWKSRKLWGIVPALAATLFVAGCPSNNAGNTTNGATSNGGTPSGQNLRFGAVVPLTGPGAKLGDLIKRGLDLGVADANAKAGGKQVEMIIEDSKTNPNEGLTAFRKLSDVNDVGTVLVAFSAVANAVAPTAEKSGKLMVGMTTSMPGLTEGRQNVIRLWPNADMFTTPLAEYAAKRFRRAAALYADDEYGQTAFTAFRQKFEQQGGRVVFDESFKVTNKEFRTTVLKMLAAKPDVIFLPGYGPGTIALLNQIREANKTIAIIGDNPLTNPPVYKAAGKAAEGIIVPATPLDAGIAKTPAQKEFLARYVKEFKENPSLNVTINHDFVQLWKDAMEKTDGSPSAVRAHFMSQKPYRGLAGDFTFKPNGEAVISVIPMQIKGGTIVNLAK